jgi:peptidoglycan/xylan/chitin deacetylase (PgdA/CDA1 family)
VEARRLKRPGPPRWRLGGTPVLLYHAVGNGPLSPGDGRYQVSLADFERHLEVVAQTGRRLASLADLWAGRAERAPAAVITVDDGRESDYRLMFPRLRERGWPADFFVNPATVGQPGYVTWAQVREMAEAGMGVQSHGYDHVTLWGLDRPALRRQLGDSRRALEDATGRKVDFLAAPFGHLTGTVVDVALEEGYRAVCTSWSWPARPHRRTMGRIAVHAHTSPTDLARVLEGRVLPYAARALRSALVYPPKRLMVALQPSRLHGAAAEHGA